MNVNLPSGDLLDANGLVTREWMTFFKLLSASASQPIAASGTTAQRPTRYVDVGAIYEDTTLGYLISVKSINPIVWVNGAGAVV